MHIHSLRLLSSQYLVVVVCSELYCARLTDNLGLWCVRVGRMKTLRNNFSPNLSFYRGRNIGPRRLVGGLCCSLNAVVAPEQWGTGVLWVPHTNLTNFRALPDVTLNSKGRDSIFSSSVLQITLFIAAEPQAALWRDVLSLLCEHIIERLMWFEHVTLATIYSIVSGEEK